MPEWVEIALKIGGTVGGVITFVVGTGLWMARREWVTRTDFAAWTHDHTVTHDELDQRLDNGEVRFARIEGKVDHLATREDLAAVTKSVSEVVATVNGIRVAVDSVGKSVEAVNRLTEMLIQNELKQEAR